MRRLLLGVMAMAVAATWADVKAEPPMEADLPTIVEDESADDWLVDRFAGNSTAGPLFFQGPAREIGGLGRCGACPTPDGTVYIPFAEGIAAVGQDGVCRLVLADRDVLQNTTNQVCAGSGIAYNPRDRRLYIAGRNCLRRLVIRPNERPTAEPVAGVTGKAGFDDGPAATATFTRIDSIVINGRGEILVLDNNERIRRLADGVVTTLNANVRAGKPVDGALADARFHMLGLGGNLCGGEDDDTLYLSDHWNFRVRRIDLKAGRVTTVAGMARPVTARGQKPTGLARRFNVNSDGPAMTHASFNSGCAYVCWDPVHSALWCGGPDESRLRWLRDGWVRTVIGAKGNRNRWPRDGVGVPGEMVFLGWNAVVAVDGRGRAYASCSADKSGLWRAYNRKEVRP